MTSALFAAWQVGSGLEEELVVVGDDAPHHLPRIHDRPRARIPASGNLGVAAC
jgi:hypothetical protein